MQNAPTPGPTRSTPAQANALPTPVGAWTDEAAAAIASALDDATLTIVAEALVDERTRRQTNVPTNRVIDYLRSTYGPNMPHVLGVLFAASEWDNGWFLDENATVYHADGTTDRVTIPVHEELTNMFSLVAASAGWGVRASDGENLFDYQYHEVEDWLRSPIR